MGVVLILADDTLVGVDEIGVSRVPTDFTLLGVGEVTGDERLIGGGINVVVPAVGETVDKERVVTGVDRVGGGVSVVGVVLGTVTIEDSV